MKSLREPRATCGAIIQKGNKVLLTKRNISPYKNCWCLPGGHIDWQEKAEKAVKREVKEETGLDFKPRFFGYYDEICPKRKWHAVALFFKGRARGEIKADQNEVRDFKWCSKKEINKLKLAFSNRQALKDYFKDV